MSQGYLTVNTRTARSSLPIENARVYVQTLNFTQSPDNTGEFTGSGEVSESFFNHLLTTDSSGSTRPLRIDTPDVNLSLNENSSALPYSVVDVYVDAEGYFPERIRRVQIFGDTISVLPVNLVPLNPTLSQGAGGTINYNIPPNQLLYSSSRNQEGPSESDTAAPFVAEDIYIPENIVVHLGVPSSNAENVTVPFTDYIKNVASSEIYPTWPENALRANIHAIISLTLNRVFTEWYKSQGYDFDITNSTRYDMAFVPGRNIFENISRIVDDIFNTYVVEGNNINPLFTSFCDGREVFCDGLLQWGTVSLAEQGNTPLQILRYYYGDNVNLQSTDNIESEEDSYPGTPLRYGDSGEDVLNIQRQLMRVRENYPAIPLIPTLDGQFDAATDAAVRAFQEIFNLTPDGIVGKSTWYRLSYIYSAVIRLSELVGEGISDVFSGTVPDVTITVGERGDYALLLQLLLNYISYFYPTVQGVARDGIFGNATLQSLNSFQRTFSLAQTNTVTPALWSALFQVYLYILRTTANLLPEQTYPGPLSIGSENEAVRLLQTYLSVISTRYPDITAPNVDGVFGPATQRAVTAFQRVFGLSPTGTVDAATWERLIETYNFTISQQS